MSQLRRLLLAVCMIALGTGTAFAAYNDTAGYPWEQSINYLTTQGFVQGYADGGFHPESRINRAEFTKIVIASRFASEEYAGFTAGCFPDVPAGQWYTPYICFARSKGIIGGNPNGTFRPADAVNQAEGLKILLLTFQQPLTPAAGEWYKTYLISAQKIGMLYFAGGNEAAYRITRGEMAYFTAWLHAHTLGKTVDQLQAIPPYVPSLALQQDGGTYVVTMQAAQVDMRVMTGNSSIRPKECNFPHHCVAEAQAESFDSFVARSHKGLVVNGAFFDAYTLALNGKNFHQIASDIIIDGVMKSMYGWDTAFGDGGMLAEMADSSFRIFYPIRDWLGVQNQVRQGISNYPLVLLAGHVRTKDEIGSHADNDAKFWVAGRRGGLGISQDSKTLYYVNTQGTVEDLGAALKKYGAYTGFALDAGSSNGMWLNGKTIFSPGRRLTTAVEFFER